MIDTMFGIGGTLLFTVLIHTFFSLRWYEMVNRMSPTDVTHKVFTSWQQANGLVITLFLVWSAVFAVWALLSI